MFKSDVVVGMLLLAGMILLSIGLLGNIVTINEKMDRLHSRIMKLECKYGI